MTFYETFIVLVIVKVLISTTSTKRATAVYHFYSGLSWRWKQEVFLHITSNHLPDSTVS
jgi:hypothetical protein